MVFLGGEMSDSVGLFLSPDEARLVAGFRKLNRSRQVDMLEDLEDRLSAMGVIAGTLQGIDGKLQRSERLSAFETRVAMRARGLSLVKG